ncbi:DMT family transporter [Labrys sp. WJW]|uniref:DMT family transporter n=1 Tax=Labrys sp. WJW TaxID=1737983 RepID=UPI00138FDB28|nr:DMT family transporter [Labrys sp. WJW]
MPELHQSRPSMPSASLVLRARALASQAAALFQFLRRPTLATSAGGYLSGLGAAVIWSGWWTVTRLGVVSDLAAADLAALRFGISGLLFLPLIWREWPTIRLVAPLQLVFMAIGAGAPYALVAATGVRLTSAGLGGAITVGLLPAFTLILSVLFLREPVTRVLIAGIACIVAGAGCVIAGTWNAGHGGSGLGFFVVGALMWAGYTVSLRRTGLQPLTATAIICVASLLLYTPVWLIISGPGHLFTAAPRDLLLQTIYQSLLSAIAALYCYGQAIRRLGATRASVFAAIVPLFSVIIAAVALHESPGMAEAAGAALLTVGAIVAARKTGSRPRPPPVVGKAPALLSDGRASGRRHPVQALGIATDSHWSQRP